jgi:opacity protein-like surface antigen
MRSPPARLAAAFAASVTAFLACPETASAYERQWHAGGSLGYALIAVNEETYHGLGGGLHLTYGLNDVFNAMLQVDFTTYPGNELVIGSAAVGVGYVVDILEWVPYIGLMAGGYQLSFFGDVCDAPEADCSSTMFGLSVPFGIDYLFTRSFAMGVQGRYHLLLSPDGAASYLTAFARAEYIWGW